MTTVDQQSIPCAVCGEESRHQILLSSNQLGSPDLDLRPAKMLRSTMGMWVQCCPSCGYCNQMIATPIPNAKEIIARDNYQKTLNDEALPELVRHFRCYAMLVIEMDLEQARLAHMYAAWVCDDQNLTELARECRGSAIAILETWQPFKDKQDEIVKGAVLVDLLRRSSRFAEAQELCGQLLAYQNVPPAVINGLTFQQELINRSDTAAYTIKEAQDFADAHAAPPETAPSPDEIVDANADELAVEHVDLKRFAGIDAEYYLEKWKQIEATGKKITWNWAAFLFHFLWFAYRKMYYYAYILAGLFLIRLSFKFQFDLPWFAGYLVKYFDWILPGMFGNYLYYHHARRKIIEAKLRNRNPQARQVAIEKMGGGSGKAVIIILLALLAAILGPALIAQW